MTTNTVTSIPVGAIMAVELTNRQELFLPNVKILGETTEERIMRWVANPPKLAPIASLVAKQGLDFRLRTGQRLSRIDEVAVLKRDGILLDKPHTVAKAREILREYRLLCGEPEEKA